jgi:diguanylate cyclase (GGDEF)-like protein/PAS domain S-box-containing protein
MNLVAALIYWVIVGLWLAVLTTVCVAFLRNPRTFGTARLLLSVVIIDTTRNIFENVYFGFYFGGRYGIFPASIVGVLSNPAYLIIPKILNVIAGSVVLSLLLLRWLPKAHKERMDIEDQIREKSETLKLESEERRRLFETSLDLILITDRYGVFTRVSPSSLTILGYDPEHMIGHSGAEFIYPPDLDATRNEMRLARRGQLTRNFETRYVHSSGRLISLAWSGVWSEPEQRHFFFGRDMTERNATEEKLRYLAHFDQLTGLPNGVSLRDELKERINLGTSYGMQETALAIFDLDGLNDINDTLGRSTGDQLLCEVGSRLSAGINGDMRIFRTESGDFAATFSSHGEPLVVGATIDQQLKRLEERFGVNGHALFLGASAGIAIAPRDGKDIEELISSAYLALKDAKRAGGRTFRLYHPSLRADAQARRVLDTELRRASAENEFELYFQPQLRCSDGMVVGAEALLRWRHPTKGILNPGAFIDALAESPAAHETGRWILDEACRAAASWRALGLPPIRMGVNLFPCQFSHGTLLDDVEAALLKSGLPPDALELEITENIALSQDDAMLQPLLKLRAKGIGLSFDDFGTGFASLSFLTRYPLTRIKIDRSFVSRISESATSDDSALLRSIIVMAHNLNLEVVAEGVETTAQANFLKKEKCEEVQGYLYACPLPRRQFESYVLSQLSGFSPRHAMA